MNPDTLAQWLLALGANPYAIAVAILLATFILEDAATAAAALLTADGAIPAPLALMALYIGIFFGDLGLYGLGSMARTGARALKWIGPGRIAKGRNWLNQRLTLALITARFVPGLRLPVYAASGYLRVSFLHFAAIAAAAAAIWTPLLFFAILWFGAGIVAALGPWKYLGVLGLVLALIVAPWIFKRLSQPRS
jgi:membrane protein DedA with SNARE-associated domain